MLSSPSALALFNSLLAVIHLVLSAIRNTFPGTTIYSFYLRSVCEKGKTHFMTQIPISYSSKEI